MKSSISGKEYQSCYHVYASFVLAGHRLDSPACKSGSGFLWIEKSGTPAGFPLLQMTEANKSKDAVTAIAGVAVTGAAHSQRKPGDYLALAIATCGVGYLPLAPGTWGSLVGIGLYLIVRGALMKAFFSIAAERHFQLLHIYYGIVAFELAIILAITLFGTWAAARVEKQSATKDPGKVVIDEVVGQYIALLPVPVVLGGGWWPVILAFILFRFFDIVKPYPARKLESLHGGLGIMLDDVVAGIYAAIVVALAVVASWLI